MQASLGELAAKFGCELIGDPSVIVSRVATLSNADSTALSFLANRAYREALSSTSAAAVIVDQKDAADCPVAALVAHDPYLTFARIAEVLHPPAENVAGVHPSAVIDTSACVAETAHIAANAVIGENTVIGEHVYIGPGCIVGTDCKIGDYSRLIANVSVIQDVTVGDRCVLHPGCVIGADGFGMAMSEEGWVKVPQIGGVNIGDDVEIGANTCIDRGAIDDTIIDDGVRLDNLIQIGHNARIGAHTAIAGMTAIAGSATVGKRCMIAGLSGVIGHVTVCDDVVIKAQALILKDIDEPGMFSATFGAEKDKVWKRMVARFKRLDSLFDRVRKLEKAASSDGN
jgi:UDP-3-O-[3-hydroxymyristoyl] glucosamine N-acyltransferase